MWVVGMLEAASEAVREVAPAAGSRPRARVSMSLSQSNNMCMCMCMCMHMCMFLHIGDWVQLQDEDAAVWTQLSCASWGRSCVFV